MPWYVYIAESRFRHLYTGITTNPELRIVKHNSGKGSQMATQQGPFKLVYVSKEFPDKSSARKREAQIKKWARAKKREINQRRMGVKLLLCAPCMKLQVLKVRLLG